MKPAEAVDVVVIGAGVTGLAFATLLASRAPVRVLLVEAREPAADDGSDMRTLAVSVGAQRVLAAAGAWQQLDTAAAGPVRAMHVWEPAGPAIDFTAGDVACPALAWVLRTATLEAALRARAAALPGISWQCPARLGSVYEESGAMRVTLDNGAAFRARCVVGADGAGSEVRVHAGIGYEREDYDQLALFSIVRTSREHDHTARQVFLDSGPLAFLPMADPVEHAVIWSTTPTQAEALRVLDDAGFAARLGEVAGEAVGLVEAVRGRAVAPLFRAEAADYVRPGIVLVGDAAHSIHPMAGQGANLGILDAAALVDCVLEGAAGGPDFSPRRLKRYQRWRRAENRLMGQALEALHWLFHRQSGLVPPVRGLGLNLANRLPALKRLFIRHASALGGDLPSAARGDT